MTKHSVNDRRLGLPGQYTRKSRRIGQLRLRKRDHKAVAVVLASTGVALLDEPRTYINTRPWCTITYPNSGWIVFKIDQLVYFESNRADGKYETKCGQFAGFDGAGVVVKCPTTGTIMPERPQMGELILADPAYPIFNIIADLADCGKVYDVIREKDKNRYSPVEWHRPKLDLARFKIAAVNPYNPREGFTVRGKRAEVATVTPHNDSFEYDRWIIQVSGAEETWPPIHSGHCIMEKLVELGF